MKSTKSLNICMILILCVLSSSIKAYKILVICSIAAGSHYNLCRGMSSVLVDRGHEVTVVGAFVRNNTGSREIVVQEMIEATVKNIYDPFTLLNMSNNQVIDLINGFLVEVSQSLFRNAEFTDLLNDKNEKFDAVVFEHYFNEYLLGIGVRLKCPIVVFSPMNLMWLYLLSDNPLSPHIMPNIYSTYSANMNLWERVVNTGMMAMQEIKGRYIYERTQEKLYEKYFPEESKQVPYHELKYQVASFLLNTHPSVGVVRPLLPNTVEIGGYHIKDPEPLSNDLKNILDSAKNGVIFFTMGSIIQSTNFNPEVKKTLLKIFSTVKETVLWKYEHDLPEKSENVIIRDWLPQTGILAHPNVKLFISHGGLLSCTEAMHFGKPMLIIPVCTDQYPNAIEFSNRGNGIFIRYDNLTETSFKWALDEMLTNKKYAEKAKHFQTLYLDRPVKPRDLAGFQIEHAIRTKGAAHLFPPRLPRHSQLLLDVVAVILVPVVAIFSFLIYCCNKLFHTKMYRTNKDKTL